MNVKDAVLNIPGNVINIGKAARHQAAMAASTIASELKNGISSGNSGRKNFPSDDYRLSISEEEEHMLKNAREKVSINIKSTPNKDALTTSTISVKQGYLMKRNEQGQWQKRFICTVPHMFMYYYDIEKSDFPRGVIDLYYYNTMNIEGNELNVLKLGADESTGLRSFYFQIDDPAVMNEWIAHLHRDRYEIIRDERDAYIQLQDQVSGEIHEATKQMESSVQDREQLKIELAEAHMQTSRAREVIIAALSRLHMTTDTDDLDACGDMLINGIDELQLRLQETIATSREEIAQNVSNCQEKIAQIEKKYLTEQTARKNGEAMLLNFKLESEVQRREAMSHFEQMSHNLQLALNTKEAVEAKLNSVSEQKKLLVKEVKGLRKKLEQYELEMDQIKTLNERLSTAATLLQDQLNGISTVLETTSGPPKLSEEDQLLLKQARIGYVFPMLSHNDPSTDPSAVTNPDSGQTEHNPVVDNSEECKEDKRKKPLIDGNEDEDDSLVLSRDNRRSWEMPAIKLKELGWLSPEQQNLVENRVSENTNSNSSQNKFSHWSFFDRSAKPSQDQTKSTTSNQSSSTFIAPLSILTSVFYSNEKEKQSVGEECHSPVRVNVPRKQSVDSFYAPVTNEADPEGTDAESSEKQPMRLHCLRCQGTVEGPKYSTCKCTIPALTMDDLNVTHNHSTGIGMIASSSLSSVGSAVTSAGSATLSASSDVIFGMFSKTSEMAGGVFRSKS